MKAIDLGGRVLHYEDGDVIFAEGSVGNETYIILGGKVNISQHIAGRNTTLMLLKKGDFFGEVDMFADTPRSVTATAMGKTELVSFTIEEIIQRQQTDFQFAIALLESMMKRLHDATATLSILMSRAYEYSEEFAENVLFKKKPMKIGEILMELGYLTESHLQEGLQKQREIHLQEHKHKLIGEILVEMGFITEEQLRQGLADQRIRLMPHG